MALNKRRGRIEIQEGWIQKSPPDVLVALFGDFYPLWIDSGGRDADGNAYLIYHGISEHFREINDGDDLPLYSPTIIIGEVCNYIEFEEIVEGG